MGPRIFQAAGWLPAAQPSRLGRVIVTAAWRQQRTMRSGGSRDQEWPPALSWAADQHAGTPVVADWTCRQGEKAWLPNFQGPRDETGRDWSRLVETGRDWSRLVETGRDWSRLVEAGRDWSRNLETPFFMLKTLIPTSFDRSRPVSTSLDQSRPISANQSCGLVGWASVDGPEGQRLSAASSLPGMLQVLQCILLGWAGVSETASQ